MNETSFARIGFRLVYKCTVCGRRQSGGFMVIERRGIPASAVAKEAEEWVPDASHMPVGWSHSRGFLCEECK